MAIARRPLRRPDRNTSGSGLSPPTLPTGDRRVREQPPRAGTPTPVLLRVPPDLLRRIDQAVESRRIQIPQHTWMLEALLEKLERDTVT
jgi:hypothetical protein